MVGPRHTECDCHCLGVPPDCFGCTPPKTLPATVEYSATGFGWVFPTTHHGVETVRVLFSGGTYRDTSTSHNTYSRPFANLNNAAGTMYRKPDGRCQWLWNDVRAMKTVWKCHKPSGTLTVLDELSYYEPLNAVDPANPWDRVIEPVVDSRCSVSISCTGSVSDSIVMTLTPQRLIVTDAFNGYFTVATLPNEGVWHWVLDISIRIGRSSISSGFGAPVPAPANGDGTLYGCANAVAYTTATPVVTADTSWVSTSTPPYRYKLELDTGQGAYFPVGGRVLTYIKAINCVGDFLPGAVLLLTYAKRTAAIGLIPGYWEMTYPETIEITLPV